MPTDSKKVAEGMDIDDMIREQLNKNGFSTESDSLSAMYSSATQMR